MAMKLNERALEICRGMVDASETLRIAHHKLDGGTLVIDCGIKTAGGLAAGRKLADVCMAGLGQIEIVPCREKIYSGPAVQVTTDSPVAACMASQYAGWELKVGEFFAMGSGPMRACANKEELFDSIGYAERSATAVGVLETRSIPTAAVARHLADACGVKPRQLVLLVAPTASQAGNLQIVARSVETAMHKLHELSFDLDRVKSGYGIAPLPPVAVDDLAGIGRTNDAILYGTLTTLYVVGDDESLREIGPQVPSNSSPDFGDPFAKIFARYDHDFYKIDRKLFSPAVVTFVNLETGNTFAYGEPRPDLLQESFASG